MNDEQSDSVRILLVEDVETDAELNKREIRTTIPESTFQVVFTKESFVKALEVFQPHVIVSDYSMPQFDGLSALQCTIEFSSITPFILCTGSINEDVAVECMKRGATDYIIKEHIKRLGPSVVNALKLRTTRIQDLKRKQREETYYSDQQYLLEASHDLLLANTIEQVQSILFESITKILPDSIIVLSKTNTNHSVGYLVDIYGIQPFLAWLQKTFSIHISNFKVPLGKETLNDLIYNQGRLVHIKNSLYTFMNRMLPEKTCQMIEKKLSISFIYHIGLSSNNEYQGGITIMQKEPLEESKTKLVEIIIKQASVAYEKISAIEGLRKQQNRLESLLKLVQMKTKSVQEFLDQSLMEVIEVTQSRVGFLIRFCEDENKVKLLCYSENIVHEYQIHDFQNPPPFFFQDLCNAAKEKKEPFQIDVFIFPTASKDSIKAKKSLHNLLVIPVIESEKVCSLLAVGERLEPYTTTDFKQATLMFDSVWKWVKQKEADQNLFQRKEQLRNILELSPISTIRCNAKGLYIESNRSLKRLLGLDTEEEPKNIECFSLFHFTKKELQDLLLNGFIHIEKRIDLKSWHYLSDLPSVGSDLLDLDIMCKKIYIDPESDIHEYILQVQDISERKQVERAKTEFINAVSHEMRTPLTSIKQSMSLMKDTLTQHIDESQLSLFDIALRNTDRLTTLIQNMLDFQKLNSYQMFFHKKFDSINDLIQRVLKDFQMIKKNKEIDIFFHLEEDLPLVYMDTEKISQVIMNLVDNAFKFTDAGSITVSTQKIEQEQQVKISVEDTGIGIDKESIQKLPIPFFQVTQVGMKKTEGSGLGLPICKKILLHHGTDFFVESTPGKGSIFSFYLSYKLEENE